MSDEDNIKDIADIDKKINEIKPLAKIEQSRAEKEEKDKEKDKMLSEFILDPNEIYAKHPFHLVKFSNDIIGIGRLMHQWSNLTDKGGNVVGKTQKSAPAIITSDKRIIPYNREFERVFKIQIRDIPTSQEERWGLRDIQSFIKEEKFASLSDTFELIVKQYKIYISMRDIWSKIHSLWDMSTYFYPLTKVFPIFELRGLPGTAKNKAMAISSSVSFNATQIMTNPSEATLFREMHKTRYFDEAEKIFVVRKDKVESDSRAEVINSGYRYDGRVPRQEKINGNFQTVWYDTFAPQMIASINGLYGATENRAIVRITTKPSQKDQQKSNLEPEPSNLEFSEIRNNLYLCLMQNWKSFQLLYEQTSNRTSLKDREYWLWKPILILAELIDPELYLEILEFAEKQQGTKNADYLPQESTDYRILTVCFNMIKAGYELLYTKDIRLGLPQNEYTPAEKTISTHLDKIGFRDYRLRDRNGSYFQIPKEIFESIVMSIAPNILLEYKDNSSQSSQSSQEDSIIEDKLNKYIVTNRDECDENKTKSVTNVTNNDELTNIFDTHFSKECSFDELLKKFTEIQINKLRTEGRIYESRSGYWRLI